MTIKRPIPRWAAITAMAASIALGIALGIALEVLVPWAAIRAAIR